MPIYEYRCSECGAHEERLQRISDAPLVDCPKCGKPALVKLVSAAGFQLKGTGWYVTDFRDKGAKPAAKSDSSAKPAEGAKPAEAAKPAESSAKESPQKSEPASPAPSKATSE